MRPKMPIYVIKLQVDNYNTVMVFATKSILL
jgi:hypothetical protein